MFNKYKEQILYIFFGIFTTLINIICYYIFAHIFKLGIIFSTVAAWILSVFFAYITNKKYVFLSQVRGNKQILKEIIYFFTCRLATGLIDLMIMLLFVNLLGFNDLIIKIISNILVIILNYIGSKLFVFKS